MRVATKPAGGYCALREGQLRDAWECYRSGRIRLVDLRTYLACHEIAARRLGGGGRYALPEVAGLTRASRPGASVNRLEAAGLLTFEPDAITFAEGSGRKVPFPRRMLRHLAAGATRSRIAAVFGHLIRCLWFKEKRCVSGGLCKASQLAREFGVDLRRVKAARADLVAMGWLVRQDVARWRLRRGAHLDVNLDWSGLPPSTAPAGTALPPPRNKDPLPGEKHQEPPAGVSLRDVQPGDLQDTARSLELHAQAVAAGLVSGSEADRLRVLAAAEHARTGRNPGGLFAAILRRGLWKVLTHQDEDSARLRLRVHLYPPRAEVGGGRQRSAEVGEDERLVAEVRGAALRAGYRGDLFYLLRREGWTRDRWDRATAGGGGSPRCDGPRQ